MNTTILPHDLAAERGLLCQLLHTPEGVSLATSIVWPDDFFVRWHAELFSVMAKLHATGRNVTRQAIEADAKGLPSLDVILDEGIPMEGVVEIAGRIRSAAILREAAVKESTRDWQMQGTGL